MLVEALDARRLEGAVQGGRQRLRQARIRRPVGGRRRHVDELPAISGESLEFG